MRNRFLGGASFLPLYGPADKPGGGEQVELALDPAEVAAHGDPDWEANDPGDIGTVAKEGNGDEDDNPDIVPGKKEEPEPVVAEAKEGEEDPAEPKEDDSDEEKVQLQKTVKALTKRLGVVTGEKRELSTKLQETIKAVPKDEPAADGGETELERSDFKTRAEFDAAVQAETNRRVALQEFNGKCNTVEAKGADTFKDGWAKAKANLAMLDDAGRIPMDILSVALETDDPARVLFVLGNDIERATELMGMTPIKRAIAMDKIATAPKAAPVVVSKTPAPVDPIGGKGSGDDRPTDRDSDEEWNRKEELRERRVAEQRRARGY